MVRSRRDFLNKGYYQPLLDAVLELLPKYIKDNDKILDAGCGECYYTANIYEYLIKQNKIIRMLGVDISKDALSVGAKRNSELELAVASVFHLPVKENDVDVLLSFFAPYCEEEFLRVLNSNGIFVRVFPLRKHLLSLKNIVYENSYENETDSYELAGFKLLEAKEIRSKIMLESNEDVQNVFSMTPYYYKTSPDDKKKLNNINKLETEIEFGILIYSKLKT